MTTFHTQYLFEVIDRLSPALQKMQANVQRSNSAMRRSMSNTISKNKVVADSFIKNNSRIRSSFSNTSKSVLNNSMIMAGGFDISKAKATALRLELIKLRSSKLMFNGGSMGNFRTGIDNSKKGINRQSNALFEARTKMYAYRNMLVTGVLPTSLAIGGLLNLERKRFQSRMRMSAIMDKKNYYGSMGVKKENFNAFENLSYAEKLPKFKEKGSELQKTIEGWAVNYGVPIKSLQDGVVKIFSASSASFKDTKNMSKQFAIYSATMGLDGSDTTNLFRAVGQVFGKGKLTAEELNRQFADVAPEFKKMLVEVGIKESGGKLKTQEDFINAMRLGKIGPGILKLLALEIEQRNEVMKAEAAKHWFFHYKTFGSQAMLAGAELGNIIAQTMDLRRKFMWLTISMKKFTTYLEDAPFWLKGLVKYLGYAILAVIALVMLGFIKNMAIFFGRSVLGGGVLKKIFGGMGALAFGSKRSKQKVFIGSRNFLWSLKRALTSAMLLTLNPVVIGAAIAAAVAYSLRNVVDAMINREMDERIKILGDGLANAGVLLKGASSFAQSSINPLRQFSESSNLQPLLDPVINAIATGADIVNSFLPKEKDSNINVNINNGTSNSVDVDSSPNINTSFISSFNESYNLA
tara:strand:- start:6620 stop:8524 length:1905 start_codon:yes stop_codon:yes gene_type:complete